MEMERRQQIFNTANKYEMYFYIYFGNRRVCVRPLQNEELGKVINTFLCKNSKKNKKKGTKFNY